MRKLGKVRLRDMRRSKGKRGGVRIIYLHVPAADCILLLDVYDKDEKADLGGTEKRMLKRLGEEFNKEITRSSGMIKRRGSNE